MFCDLMSASSFALNVDEALQAKEQEIEELHDRARDEELWANVDIHLVVFVRHVDNSVVIEVVQKLRDIVRD